MTLIQHNDTTQCFHCPQVPLCGCSKRCTVGSRCLVCILIRLFSYCSVLRVFFAGTSLTVQRLGLCGSTAGEFHPRLGNEDPTSLEPWTPVLQETVTPVCGLSFQPPETYFSPFLWVHTAFEQDILVLNLWQQSNISKCPSHYESSDR